MSPAVAQLRVAHVITGLDTGGAELMLYKLLSMLDPQRVVATVISLLPPGDVGVSITRLGIPVYSLGMRRGGANLGALVRLVRLLRQTDADIVQTWLYHADLLGTLAKPWLGQAALLWNLRQSDLDPTTSKLSTRAVARLCAGLSWVAPRGIVCCSERTRAVHSALGYRAGIMTVIPNGFDLERFRPDPAARANVRAALGISRTTQLIGLIARYDPQKDLPTFLEAVRQTQASLPECHVLLCGRGMQGDNVELSRLVRAAGLKNRLHLIGPSTAPERVMNALDLLVSASAYGEGFPNVIGEAMACCVPCAVTDVGDSATIVGDTGTSVPPRDPAALATAIVSLLAEGGDALARRGQAARHKIACDFSLPEVAERYYSMYRRMRLREA